MTEARPENTIAFQGVPGAYSHLACRNAFPQMTALPCRSFEDAFDAVTQGRAKLAMIPIENSIAGRVADIHHLLPDSGLYIVGEHFQRVNHCLLGVKGAVIGDVKEVHSHLQALSQCRNFIRGINAQPMVHADTAGAAEDVAQWSDKAKAAIASELAAEIYGLTILRRDIEDASHNTTRMVVMSRSAERPQAGATKTVTSVVFQVRNVPAALYKALGGFATNGVNMVKLESYQLGGSFAATQFYLDVEGHIDDRNVALAIEELQFFTNTMRVLGVYPASAFRSSAG